MRVVYTSPEIKPSAYSIFKLLGVYRIKLCRDNKVKTGYAREFGEAILLARKSTSKISDRLGYTGRSISKNAVRLNYNGYISKPKRMLMSYKGSVPSSWQVGKCYDVHL